jgi:hypothetical protein
MDVGICCCQHCEDFEEIRKLFNLKDTLKKLGLKVKKRFILKGICRSFLVKLGTSVLTIGHDDIVEVCAWTTSHLIKSAKWLSSDLQGKLSVLPRLEELRMRLPGVRTTSEHMETPVKAYQKALGWEGDGHGWNSGLQEVAGQILGTGSVVVATEKYSDLVLDKPADKAIEYFDRTAHRAKTDQAMADLEAHKRLLVCDECFRAVGNTVHYHCKICTGVKGFSYNFCVKCYDVLGRRCIRVNDCHHTLYLHVVDFITCGGCTVYV